MTVGYVLGERGDWRAYTAADWRRECRGRSRRSRRAPLSQWSPQATVGAAAEAVRLMIAYGRVAS